MNLILNFKNIVEVAPAASREDTRPWLQYVHIEDDKNTRTRSYVATDGHILFRIEDPIPEDEDILSEPLNIFVKDKKISFKRNQPSLYMAEMLQGAVRIGNELFTLGQDNYPDWKRIIPSEQVKASSYIGFKADNLKKTAAFFGNKEGIIQMIPYQKDENDPAMWIEGNRLALLMPVKLV